MITKEEIAAQLGETGAAPREQIARILSRCGEALANTVMQETLAFEGSGGMMTKDGSQRRTPCGVYFELVHQRVESDDWFFITHGYARGEKINKDAPMAWTDLLSTAQEALTKSGKVSSISMMVVGTPTRITPRDGYTLVVIEQEEIPPLPKGLPMPPSAATSFLVGIAQYQWRAVERFVENGEPLIILGYPLPDENKGRVVVYAERADTPSTKKIKSKGRRSNEN